jgi:hypothetical protein
MTSAQAGLLASSAGSMLTVAAQPLKERVRAARIAIFFIKNRLPLVCD